MFCFCSDLCAVFLLFKHMFTILADTNFVPLVNTHYLFRSNLIVSIAADYVYIAIEEIAA